MEIDNKLKEIVKEWRDFYYNQAREDAHDERDQELLDHIEREALKETDEEVFDRVRDLILDSIGS